MEWEDGDYDDEAFQGGDEEAAEDEYISDQGASG